jgi:thioredoxin reductase (NADPH)
LVPPASGNFTGLRVIGSRDSKDTFRIRDFLAKNRVLFTWLDLEADLQVKQLLKQFELTEADTHEPGTVRLSIPDG